MTTATVDNLNSILEFDLVVEVHPDGTVTPRHDLLAPSLLDDELDSPHWVLLDGYSGQHGYRGPIMHASEFIGGGMARDVLATPGVYVALVSSYTTDADGEPAGDDGDLYVEGWALARWEG